MRKHKWSSNKRTLGKSCSLFATTFKLHLLTIIKKKTGVSEQITSYSTFISELMLVATELNQGSKEKVLLNLESNS